MAALDTVGCVMVALVRNLSSSIKELEDYLVDARAVSNGLNETKVALDIFDVDLGNAKHRIHSVRFNATRKVMTNSLNVMREFTPVLAGSRYQLPEGVLSTAVDGLSKPITCRAAREIIDVVLGEVRELNYVVTADKFEAMNRLWRFSAYLEEDLRVSLRLRCTCKRLQHAWR